MTYSVEIPPTDMHTAEERQVDLYGGVDPPTFPAAVNGETPLDQLRLNWTEKQLPERERTKHVHRLHPYLGKYIPQLVEVFLRKYISPSDTVLDPFCGSGTTLVQANELEVNSIGCDISAFNVLLCEVKTASYDVSTLRREASDIVQKTSMLTRQSASSSQCGLFDEAGPKAVNATDNEYLNLWFAPRALEELLTFRSLIPNYRYQDFLKIVLSRAARSARLTTHFDLDFPKKPTTAPYECYKHGRICVPTETAFKFISRYCLDGVRRVAQFSRLRTAATVACLHGDSRELDIPPVDAVVTSPPYVGLIDYHEQHRYAYELLGLADNRTSEIGAAAMGQSRSAKRAYCCGMVDVFRKATSALRPGGVLVVVAADRHGLYPNILGELGLCERGILQRHVNRRTGRRSGEFYESIFVYAKPKKRKFLRVGSADIAPLTNLRPPPRPRKGLRSHRLSGC